MPESPSTTRRVAIAVLLATGVAAAGTGLAAPGMMARVLELRDVATSATTPGDVIQMAPALVLVTTPLVVLSALWLLLAPGLLLTTAWLRSDTLGHWLGMGLAISLVVVSAVVEIAEYVAGGPITGRGFIGLVTVVAVVAGLAAMARPRHRWTGRAAGDDWTGQAVPMGALTAALVIGLFPKFFLEAFNGDGAHTYDATRLLLFRTVAFFGESAGGISGFPGPTSVLFTYPGGWFLRIFGETEASVRLPLLLYLAVLGPVLLTTASVGGRRPRAVHAWLVDGSLAVFAVVLAFSATYDPYAADIALPATQDTLFLVLFLTIVTATLEHRLLAIALLTVLAVLCSQAAVALTAFWLVARWIADREARRLVVSQALAAAAGVVAANLLVRVVVWLGVPAPGAEHGLLDLLRKFVVLQVTDVRRILFVLAPVGLYPVLAVTALRRRNPSVDALALLLAASFGLYYVMAYYSLHYFVPAMILCLLLFWRTELAGDAPRGRWFPPAAAVMVTVSLLLSLPVEAGIYTATRDIGRRIDVSAIAGYATAENSAWAHLDDLSALFPKDMDPAVPDEAYGGSPLAFHIYAQQARMLDAPRDYAFGPDAAGAWRPTVLNDAAFARDRVLEPRGSRGSRLYDIPRDLLFGRGAARAGFPVLDFTPLARRLLAYAQTFR